MFETNYLHTSFSGTFPVPCEILSQGLDGYNIRFLDPYLGKWIEREGVGAQDLQLQQFSDIVGF